MDRDIILGKIDKNSYLWCLTCERTYKYGNFKQIIQELDEIEILQVCPYENCDGDTVIGAQEWNSIRGQNPEYPEIPVEGQVYPLYPA